MPKRALIMVSAALCLAVPSLARAADDAEAWTPTETAIRATTAGISLPQTIGSLSLTKSGEASNGGRAVDNYAQFLSDDGVIQATLYVYLPTYADASLAAYMTDKAIMERFGSRTRRTAYEATRSATRRVVIQAVCIDDRQTPHPAAQLFPERDVRDIYDGELYRCVAGARLQATIAEFSGQVDFSGGQTLVCAKGEALYHAPGGQVTCRPQKAARDCHERSLLRRFGAGVKILTMYREEEYTEYREEVQSATVVTGAITLDGGVGGRVF